MKKLFHILIAFLLVSASTYAEVVVLRSGQQIKGEILINNDEVVILRKNDGTRYQYPKQEILRIEAESNTITTEEEVTETVVHNKNVAIRFAASAGTSYIRQEGWGGSTSLDLMIGTHNLANQGIFLGGSIGYNAAFINEKDYSWITLQGAVQVPFATESRHSPIVGYNLGYSFATKKHWGGGLCTGIDLGWCYTFNQESSLSITANAQWQQTRINIKEDINNIYYDNTIHCPILRLGVKVGIQF